MNTIFPNVFYLHANEQMPNNSTLPVLVYRKVFDAKSADKKRQFQHCFEQSGWKGIWKNGIYDYHHFHSASHEALGIASGTVEVQLGGEEGEAVSLDAGDLLVLPAGTGHKRVAASGNLVVIGAYPDGQQDYDVCRHRNDCADVSDVIDAVPLPQTDPVYGSAGPLLKIWVRQKNGD